MSYFMDSMHQYLKRETVLGKPGLLQAYCLIDLQDFWPLKKSNHKAVTTKQSCGR